MTQAVAIQIDLELLQKVAKTLCECAEDLDAELRVRYPETTMHYPSEKRRRDRDMEPVVMARFYLSELGRLPGMNTQRREPRE